MMFERFLNNTFASLFIAYLFDQVFYAIRAYFTGRNLSRKTLIDDRFLV